MTFGDARFRSSCAARSIFRLRGIALVLSISAGVLLPNGCGPEPKRGSEVSSTRPSRSPSANQKPSPKPAQSMPTPSVPETQPPAEPKQSTLASLPGLPGLDAPPKSESAPKPESTSKREPSAELRDEAVRAADGLVQRYPGSPVAVAVMALVHNRFGRTSEAAACWRKCLNLKPDFAEAHLGLGSIALKTGRYAEAETEFRAAASDSSEAALRQAEALMHLGRMQDAMAALAVHRKASPPTTESQCLLGQCLLQLRQYDEARKEYEAAVALDSNCTYAYHGLATAWTRLGDAKKSEQCRVQFQRLKEADQAAEKANLKAFDDLRAVRASVAFCLTAAGRVCLTHGDSSGAEEHWCRAAELDPQASDCRRELSALYQQKGRLTPALKVLDQLAAIEPKDPIYRINAGIVHAGLERFGEAEKSFREAISVAPERPEGYAALVQLFLRTNRRLDEAERLARKAAELAGDARSYAMLAVVCEKNGHLKEAREAIQVAVKLDPNSEQHRELQEWLTKER